MKTLMIRLAVTGLTIVIGLPAVACCAPGETPAGQIPVFINYEVADTKGPLKSSDDIVVIKSSDYSPGSQDKVIVRTLNADNRLFFFECESIPNVLIRANSLANCEAFGDSRGYPAQRIERRIERMQSHVEAGLKIGAMVLGAVVVAMNARRIVGTWYKQVGLMVEDAEYIHQDIKTAQIIVPGVAMSLSGLVMWGEAINLNNARVGEQLIAASTKTIDVKATLPEIRDAWNDVLAGVRL